MVKPKQSELVKAKPLWLGSDLDLEIHHYRFHRYHPTRRCQRSRPSRRGRRWCFRRLPRQLCCRRRR